MSDLISRKMLLEDIDSWVAMDSFERKYQQSVREVVESFPSEQSEIIRCKNCEYHHTIDCPMTYEEYISWEEDGYIESDNILHDNAEDEGYCHKAERREDG